MTVSADEQKMTVSGNGQKTMKRVVVDHYGGPEVLKVVEERRSSTGAGRGARQGSGRGRVVHRCPDARRHVHRGRPEATVHARLRARRRRRRARPGLLEAAGGRPHRGADGVGRRRGTRLRAGGGRGRRPRGPRSGGGPEPPVPVHDVLPGAPPDGEGQARGDGARARRGRQGRRRGARARERWPGFASSGPLRLAIATRSRRSARWRSTTATRTSWRGCARRPAVWTSSSTASVARSRCARSARCGPAEGSSCSAATTRSRMGTRTGRR